MSNIRMSKGQSVSDFGTNVKEATNRVFALSPRMAKKEKHTIMKESFFCGLAERFQNCLSHVKDNPKKTLQDMLVMA